MAKNRAIRRESGVGETIRTVIYAVLIALAVRTFLFEPFNIPSGSMMPTLLIGDYLFVSKFSYGYSGQSVTGGLVDFDGRVMPSMPERGDVAVFKLPDTRYKRLPDPGRGDGCFDRSRGRAGAPEERPGSDYIKRIIGLPGDSIAMEDGILIINGDPVTRTALSSFNERTPQGILATGDVFRETLPGGRSYTIRAYRESGRFDSCDAFAVPEGYVFVLGDNRHNSRDSRFVGFIPIENLVGRAEVLWFSIDTRSAKLWQIWKWPGAVRWGRIFDGIV